MHNPTEKPVPGIGTLAVIGPDGKRLTRDDLPPKDTVRWVIRRKAEVVAGVRAGLLTLDEACAMYSLSIDEFLLWQRQLDRHGLEGLKVTRIAEYRDADRPEDRMKRAAE